MLSTFSPWLHPFCLMTNHNAKKKALGQLVVVISISKMQPSLVDSSIAVLSGLNAFPYSGENFQSFWNYRKLVEYNLNVLSIHAFKTKSGCNYMSVCERLLQHNRSFVCLQGTVLPTFNSLLCKTLQCTQCLKSHLNSLILLLHM